MPRKDTFENDVEFLKAMKGFWGGAKNYQELKDKIEKKWNRKIPPDINKEEPDG